MVSNTVYDPNSITSFMGIYGFSLRKIGDDKFVDMHHLLKIVTHDAIELPV